MPTPNQLRSQVAGLSRLAENDLRVLFRRVENAAEAATPLRQLLPALVETYGSAAATVAADWYDELRDEQRVRGRFRALAAAVADPGAESLVGYAASTSTDYSAFQTLVIGGLSRRIANAARQTVMDSTLDDPAASGWQRVGSGECAFCAMLIGRGAVYSEASADFASHDHCNCAAVPAFEGKPRPVKPYTPSSRNITDADRARVRDYLRSH